MRAFGPELALDFQGSLKSGLASWLSGARVRMSFERRHVREWSHLFATHRVSLDAADRHRVRRALALARAAGAGEGEPVVDLALTEEERARARERASRWRGSGASLVALAPFTSRLQAWKRYPLERWSEIARALATRGMTVIVIAGPGEEREGHALAAASGPGVSVCEGLGLRDLTTLLGAARSSSAVTRGPMHMAWAVGTRVVARIDRSRARLTHRWARVTRGSRPGAHPTRRAGQISRDHSRARGRARSPRARDSAASPGSSASSPPRARREARRALPSGPS
jgi:heptosyltransferase-1